MTELERLKQRLTEMGAGKLYVDAVEGATDEQIAASVNRVFDAMERGEAEEVDLTD